jgi:hypothetical protein
MAGRQLASGLVRACGMASAARSLSTAVLNAGHMTVEKSSSVASSSATLDQHTCPVWRQHRITAVYRSGSAWFTSCLPLSSMGKVYKVTSLLEMRAVACAYLAVWAATCHPEGLAEVHTSACILQSLRTLPEPSNPEGAEQHEGSSRPRSMSPVSSSGGDPVLPERRAGRPRCEAPAYDAQQLLHSLGLNGSPAALRQSLSKLRFGARQQGVLQHAAAVVAHLRGLGLEQQLLEELLSDALNCSAGHPRSGQRGCSAS